MNEQRDFARSVSGWLVERAGSNTPGYLDDVLARTQRTRQRPAWSSLERWLPVDLTLNQRIPPIQSLARAAAIVVVLALAVAGLLIAVAAQHRVPHLGLHTNGALTYVDGTTLKLVSAEGTIVGVGAAIPVGSESLTFSPDGTQLAYRGPGNPASIFVADADGSNPRSITGSVAAASSEQAAVDPPFAFAPDGRRIAFTATGAGSRSIRVVDVDGRNMTTIGPIGAAATDESFDPAWSPDGQWIAFIWSQPAKGDLAQIYLTHPDGSGGHVLAAANPNPAALELAWSPDPARPLLAYLEGGNVSGGTVAIRDVTAPKPSYAGHGYSLWITWSPDGKQVAWWDGRTAVAKLTDVLAGKGSQPIYLYPDISGGNCAAHPDLVGQAICGPAQWSPDSTLVYGTAVGGQMILVRRADGTGSVQRIPLDHPVDITNGPNGSLAWRPIAP